MKTQIKVEKLPVGKDGVLIECYVPSISMKKKWVPILGENCYILKTAINSFDEESDNKHIAETLLKVKVEQLEKLFNEFPTLKTK